MSITRERMEEFANLVDQYYQALYRFGFSLAKDPDRASDLVQQTFVIWAQKGHQPIPNLIRREAMMVQSAVSIIVT